MVVNKCEFCGTEFKTKHPSQKYCSSLCRRRARTERDTGKRPMSEDRQCLHCGAPISGHERADKIYCSKACKINDHRVKRPSEKEAIRSLSKSLAGLIKEEEGTTEILCKGKAVILDKKYEECFLSLTTYVSGHGYCRTTYRGTSVRIHRLLYYMGHRVHSSVDWPIDHINQNKLDNRLCNLRLVSVSVNNSNKKYSNKTNYRGVYKSGDRFLAQVWSDGKNHHVGYYDTPEEAAIARSKFLKSSTI